MAVDDPRRVTGDTGLGGLFSKKRNRPLTHKVTGGLSSPWNSVPWPKRKSKFSDHFESALLPDSPGRPSPSTRPQCFPYTRRWGCDVRLSQPAGPRPEASGRPRRREWAAEVRERVKGEHRTRGDGGQVGCDTIQTLGNSHSTGTEALSLEPPSTDSPRAAQLAERPLTLRSGQGGSYCVF